MVTNFSPFWKESFDHSFEGVMKLPSSLSRLHLEIIVMDLIHWCHIWRRATLFLHLSMTKQ